MFNKFINWLKKHLGIPQLERQLEILQKRTRKKPLRFDEIERARSRSRHPRRHHV